MKLRYEKIDSKLFESNRKAFFNQMQNNSFAVFNANDIMPTNGDGIMGFKQNSDLFYLSGIDQEESILLLIKGDICESHLFIKETSELIKIWEGDKLSMDLAAEISGIAQIHWLDKFDSFFDKAIKASKTVYLNSNEHNRASREVESRDERFRKKNKDRIADLSIEKAAPMMHQLRFIKQSIEVEQIQKAIDITEGAFRRILPFISPGKMEYEIEAEVTHYFIKNRSRGHAYDPIIASGANACVLHYISNNEKLAPNDLILMDFGAEYANYNADLTRCVPASGRFTTRQREIYEAVLRVLKAATAMLTPGNTWETYNREVGELMEAELVSLNLLSVDEIKKQDPKKPAYRKYFMHGTSHSLGIDVHDVDDRTIPFEAGMVFTCEPGIYALDEGIGVRLENNILITSEGPKNLMKNIPIEAEEIEDLMN